MYVLHREYFTYENPSDRHYAHRRGDHGHEKQNQFGPGRVVGSVEKQSDDSDEQEGQRTNAYGRQQQAPLAHEVHQQYGEYVSGDAARRVHGLRKKYVKRYGTYNIM